MTSAAEPWGRLTTPPQVLCSHLDGVARAPPSLMKVQKLHLYSYLEKEIHHCPQQTARKEEKE